MSIHDRGSVRVLTGQAIGHSIRSRAYAQAGGYLDSRVDNMVEEVFPAVLFRLGVWEKIRKSRMEGFRGRHGLCALLVFEINHLGEAAQSFRSPMPDCNGVYHNIRVVMMFGMERWLDHTPLRLKLPHALLNSAKEGREFGIESEQKNIFSKDMLVKMILNDIT